MPMLGPNDLQSLCLRGRPVTADDFSPNQMTAMQRYRILGKKGEGSFAEVMACQNMSDGQLYACKTLKRHFVSVDQALGLTEIRALRRLRPHVNVVQLHDII
ncbi:MAPK/MAK/MRK overlapping kinase-like, partial [Stegodyphus dumicola]|uniref:MAPK/MAK/MRK overlapping kinase-like n=1 Tax=Stegodyphus dumicola TaxID=202533 RepID=UPI0015B2F2C6